MVWCVVFGLGALGAIAVVLTSSDWITQLKAGALVAICGGHAFLALTDRVAIVDGAMFKCRLWRWSVPVLVDRIAHAEVMRGNAWDRPVYRAWARMLVVRDETGATLVIEPWWWEGWRDIARAVHLNV